MNPHVRVPDGVVIDEHFAGVGPVRPGRHFLSKTSLGLIDVEIDCGTDNIRTVLHDQLVHGRDAALGC